MATYIDVAALVGIKIVTTGALTTDGSTYTVPSDSYALVSVLSTGGNQSDGNAMMMKVVPAGNVITRTSSTSVTVSGVTFGVAGAVVNFVVFSNNQ